VASWIKKWDKGQKCAIFRHRDANFPQKRLWVLTMSILTLNGEFPLPNLYFWKKIFQQAETVGGAIAPPPCHDATGAKDEKYSTKYILILLRINHSVFPSTVVCLTGIARSYSWSAAECVKMLN